VKRLKLVAVVALAGAIGCGIRIGRDLGTMTPQAVIYDDVCKMQDYFDAVTTGQEKAPDMVSSTDISKGADGSPTGGRATFAFQTDSQLRVIRRVLNENWEKLPEKLMKSAQRIDLEVKWAEKAGVRRVVTTEDAQLTFDGTSTFLPYHICLSELLFGAPLYKTRRDLLGLPPLPVPADAQAADDARPDGGAAADVQAVH
jgi:hypothetical protein